jgi:DNA mismatch endonuclease (patch repair protein)
VVFPKQRLAVFVDGCFWHGCAIHGRVPGGSNARYWTMKLARNQQRDAEDSRLLGEAGWTVLRVWEHVPVDEAADLVERFLGEIDKESASRRSAR